MEIVEIPKESFDKLVAALKRAKHDGFEDCSAEICKLIKEALKEVGQL